MNLKQLEAFVAVAETSSFSKAAQVTFITQSTVSQHISFLEELFGVKLLDRTGKGAFLTEGGKVLYQHARKAVQDVQTIHNAMRRFTKGEELELRIGGSNIPAVYMIPALLSAMAEKFPSLRITLLQGDSQNILAGLAAEQVELAIVGNMFAKEEFRFTHLCNDEIRLVVPAGHPWGKRAAIELAELPDCPLILREPGSGTGKTVADALAKSGVEMSRLKAAAILGSNEAVKNAIINGVGYSFVSMVSLRRELKLGELAIVEVNGLQISRSFYLATRAGRELSPVATAFAELAASLKKYS